MKDVKIINIMADGSICEDLSTYIEPEHPSPDDACRLILKAIRDGYAIRNAAGN